MKVGLVLSGGAVRGLAHIGVLKALKEYGIVPSVVSGVSAGSIIGLFYCSGYSPEEMERIALKTNVLEYVKPAFSKKALFTIDSMEKFIKSYIKYADLSELPVPFYVCVTNLNRASVEYLSKGDIVETVKASCSLPILFKPVKIGEYYYVDGGVMNNLPVEPLLAKVDYIIGVEVNPFLEEERDFSNMVSIGVRSFYLAIRSNIESRKPLCNMFIQPPELVNIPLFATNRKRDVIEIGYLHTKTILKGMVGEII
ncbi:MAG: patatin-like phospholipase family protein [Hydrogenothermaceae bacterium]|nr:patatin-like phospholipase family protein [Hydrogenothermaceae bacterium]